MTCQRRNSVTDHGNASRANTIAVPQTPGKQAERARPSPCYPAGPPPRSRRHPTTRFPNPRHHDHPPSRPSHCSRRIPTFTEDTLPAALQAEHTLATGHWAVLNVLEGSLRFVNLQTGEARLISAPNLVTIHPGLPHKVAIEGPLRCRIAFFREPPTDSVDDEGSTIGEIMDSAAEFGKRGVRKAKAGVGAVTKAARRIPHAVRRVAGKDDTGTETPPEKVIVEGLTDEAMKCYLSVLVWLVHTDDKQIDEREMCQIQLLMTQRRCNAAVRKAVREHLEKPHSLDSREQIDHMLRHGPAAGTETQRHAMGSGQLRAGPGVAPGADAAGGPAHPPGSDHQPRRGHVALWQTNRGLCPWRRTGIVTPSTGYRGR